MKIIVGDLQVTQTKKGYKLTALGKEYYENIPNVYESYGVRKLRDVKEYFPNLSYALNRAIKLDPQPFGAIEEILGQYDKQVEGFGIEAIRQEETSQSYWYDTRAIYVNTGDTYFETLLYDAQVHKFFMTSWGDFVETRESKKCRFI